MKPRHLFALVAPALLLAGCIRTFHPIYTEETIVTEPALIGEWGKADSDERWIFADDKDKRYRLVVLDDQRRKCEFTATLTTIGDRRFLDLFPRETEDDGNEFLKFHFVPHHTFFWVKAVGPRLELAAPNPERIEKLFAENPDALPHIKRQRHDLILTATTEQLRAFITTELPSPESFTEPSDLSRLQIASP